MIPNSCGILSIGEKIGNEGQAREFWQVPDAVMFCCQI